MIGWLDTGNSWFSDVDENIFDTDGETVGASYSYDRGFTILDGAGGIGSAPDGGRLN